MSKPSKILSVSPNLCVCLTIFGHVVLFLCYLLGQYRLENVKPTSSDDLFIFLSSSQLEKKPQKHVLANGLLSELCLVSALENVCLLLGSYTPTGFTNALVL